jgi:GGDEF domain-containing protein
MDPLTEALNRHAFHSLLSRSERGKESMTYGSVAVLDIDNLKPINDTMYAQRNEMRRVISNTNSFQYADHNA